MSGRVNPRVVALGGGHGLAATLRAVRLFSRDITAIVSVADDGGSSGRLRDAFGIPAPGDLRKCLVALSDEQSLWSRAFEHRFEAGELEGHAMGNLVIATLAVTTGDLVAALAEAGRLLGSEGRVLPATRHAVVLKAVADGGEVEGQVAVAATRRIAGVSIVPPDAEAPDEAVAAIAAADLVVFGPGSLFTSVLAAIAVPGIRDAVAQSRARKVYVCNLRAQVPETAGYDVAAHVEALVGHGVDPDLVVYDPSALPVGDLPVTGVPATLTDGGPAHDPERLAAVLQELVG